MDKDNASKITKIVEKVDACGQVETKLDKTTERVRQIKYSVVIPIYNKEDYIDDCIQSILDQRTCDLEQMELILINDGSKDNSLNICIENKESIEICDKNKLFSDLIVIVDKPNSGVSDTRNLGIELARGEYIMFLDADDTWSTDFIKTIDKIIETDEPDILFYGSCRDKSQLGTESTEVFDIHESDKNNLLKSVVYNQHLIKNCKINFNRVTDYVVSAKLLRESNVRFDKTLKVGEDKLFNFELFQHIKNISYTNKKLYYIRTNGKSVMGSYNRNALEVNKNLYNAFSTHISQIEDACLNKELQLLKTCLGFQVVWNTITSDYCHKDNPKKISERKTDYNNCKVYLQKEALEQLNEYEKYLFKVFNYPFEIMNFIMKNRLVRGAWFYCHKLFKW